MMENKKVDPNKKILKFETWLAIKDSKESAKTSTEISEMLDQVKRAVKRKNYHVVVLEGETETWYINWNYETDWFELNLIGESF